MVLDTNVVLDLLVFDDPTVAPLRSRLDSGIERWLATAVMRDELVRVLSYPTIAAWLRRRSRVPALVAAQALVQFDRLACIVGPARAAPLACSDPHDQMFIDLAYAHAAELQSKDGAVIHVWRRLRRFTAAAA